MKIKLEERTFERGQTVNDQTDLLRGHRQLENTIIEQGNLEGGKTPNGCLKDQANRLRRELELTTTKGDDKVERVSKGEGHGKPQGGPKFIMKPEPNREGETWDLHRPGGGREEGKEERREITFGVRRRWRRRPRRHPHMWRAASGAKTGSRHHGRGGAS